LNCPSAAKTRSGNVGMAAEYAAFRPDRSSFAFPSASAAFVSVSLSAAGTDEDDVKGLAQCVSDFTRRTGWTPATVHHAAGAFRYTQYDFFKRWALKYIAWRKGAPTDTSQDCELTDWPALERFAAAVAANRN
jgi:menaquinone-dependent protoporphyrinogen oxidase